jgi:hypothetical protein
MARLKINSGKQHDFLHLFKKGCFRRKPSYGPNERQCKRGQRPVNTLFVFFATKMRSEKEGAKVRANMFVRIAFASFCIRKLRRKRFLALRSLTNLRRVFIYCFHQTCSQSNKEYLLQNKRFYTKNRLAKKQKEKPNLQSLLSIPFYL